MGQKYLEDVMERSDEDYEEAMETIERQQKMMCVYPSILYGRGL